MIHEVEQPRLPGMPPPPAPKHHSYGMSKLNMLAACPGFTSREGTNQAAEDGTRLHDVMEKVVADIIKSGSTAKNSLGVVLHGVTISEEEQFHLEFCCKALDFWLVKKPLRIVSEGRVSIYNPDETELNFGTYDLLVFLTEETAIGLDWKFGWIPVPPANSNWQGKGYAVGVFQKYPRLKKLGFQFVQPKLHLTTSAMYQRENLFEMYSQVRDVISAAQAAEKSLHPCQYCDFCAVAGTCKALLNEAQKAVSIHEGLPMPASFVGLQINTPEDAARALYVVSRLEILISESGLKERAKELARATGGKLSCQISPTETVMVELKQRNAPRSANSPMLIAEALKAVLSPEQVLGACDPKITRLEEIFADAYVEKMEAEAKAILEAADEAALLAPMNAKEIHKTALAQAKATRSTKKHAIEILNDALLSDGLVTAPEGKVDYLKVRVEKHEKQIT